MFENNVSVRKSKNENQSIAKLFLWIFLFFSILFVFYQYFANYRAGLGITYYGISLSILFFVTMMLEKLKPIYVPKPLVVLGNMSFSVFLSHSVIHSVLSIVIIPFFPFSLYGFKQFVFEVIVILIVCYFIYSFIEVKFTSFLKNKILNRIS